MPPKEAALYICPKCNKSLKQSSAHHIKKHEDGEECKLASAREKRKAQPAALSRFGFFSTKRNKVADTGTGLIHQSMASADVSPLALQDVEQSRPPAPDGGPTQLLSLQDLETMLLQSSTSTSSSSSSSTSSSSASAARPAMRTVAVQSETPEMFSCPGFVPSFAAPLYANIALKYVPEFIRVSHLAFSHMECKGTVSVASVCDLCANLQYNTKLMKALDKGSRDYATFTPDEKKINDSFLSMTQLMSRAAELRAAKDQSRMHALNLQRKCNVALRTSSDRQRLIVAFANADVPRLRYLIRSSLQAGRSPASMIGLIQDAVAGERKIFQFSEKERDIAFLVLKLGGPKLLHAVSRANGLPNLSVTKERGRTARFHVKDIFDVSVVDANLRAFSSVMDGFADVPCSLMVDEIALERAVRFDAHSNLPVGFCSEHVGAPEPLTSYTQLVALKARVDDGDLHVACEATVIAVAPHRADANAAIPLVIVPTCKSKLDDAGRSMAERQRSMLAAVIRKLRERKLRVTTITSDGDGARRQAFHTLTNCSSIDANSPLFALLKDLKLLCLACGEFELSARYDDKHNAKRFRQRLKCLTGWVVYQTKMTGATLAKLCEDLGLEFDTGLLNPEDGQNVRAAVKLIKILGIIANAPCPEGKTLGPATVMMVKEVRIFACIADGILEPLFGATLSLSDQLVKGSQMAHIVGFLHGQLGAKCLPNQLYHDLQSNVKDLYVSVAKWKVYWPESPFFTFLLGDDRLETDFGIVRTISHDRGVDALQLGERIGEIVQADLVLGRHEGWRRPSARLDVKVAEDHMNAKAWMSALDGECKGSNYMTRDVHLASCWALGRAKAIEVLQPLYAAHF